MSPLQSTFEVTQRHGIWRVTLDGMFFGDYRSKAGAVAGIGESEQALGAEGRFVKIVMPEEEAPWSSTGRSPGLSRPRRS